MKGKKISLRIMIIVVLIACAVVVGLIICFKNAPMEFQTNENVTAQRIPISEGEYTLVDSMEKQPYVENQVLAIADSKREAKKIAQAVGGELISYDNQVAVIQIGITVEEMMKLLEADPSLPKVYPNYQNYTN